MLENRREIGVGFFHPTDKMRELVGQVLDSGRISYGPLCEHLEEEFARTHGSRFAVVSASGTDSLRAGLHAMKIFYEWPDGAEVIVPATTFVATINIITQIGLKPVFVDVDPVHYCMDPALIEDKITFDTVAILPVNLLGQPADLETICGIANTYGLPVMEDSAECMFVGSGGRTVGSWGEVAGFSFYMAHLITSGVGGIATTSSDQMYEIMRSLLNHGREPSYISIDDDDGLAGDELAKMISNRFKFLYPGYSSRMTELQAALAIPQLASWPEMLATRQAVASWLTRELSEYEDAIQLPSMRENGEHSFMMYGIKLRDGDDKLKLVRHLEEYGIETRDILPLVNQPIFSDWYDGDPGDFPVSLDLVKRGFYIGSHHGMSEGDIAYIHEVFDEYMRTR